jgi:hypothetical protein
MLLLAEGGTMSTSPDPTTVGSSTYVDGYGVEYQGPPVQVVDDYGNLVTGNPEWRAMREEGPFTWRKASIGRAS